jgi:LPXTG-site transpeptidase (sortase) family protein
VTVATPPLTDVGAASNGDVAAGDQPASSGVSGLYARSRASASGVGRSLAEGEGPRYVIAGGLLVVAVLTIGFFLDMVVVSRLEYRAAQATSFAHLRNELALGSAPVDQQDQQGRLLRAGTPVALLTIPSLHLRTVVSEGTTSAVLMRGPGLLRTSVMPGEAGTSVIFGRAAAYGAPFHRISSLPKGAKITVTTGAGPATYTVTDVRRAGSPLPPTLTGQQGRLTLVTATGMPFLPSGVLRVDADLTGTAQPSAAPQVDTVPKSEQPLGTDTSNLWATVFLLQALILASVGAVWSWRRWGHAQTWIVFFPLFALLGLVTGDQFARFLPNLL